MSRLHHGFAAAHRHPVLAAGALLIGAGTVVLGMRPLPLPTHPAGVALAFAHMVLRLAVLTGQFGAVGEVSDHTLVWAAFILPRLAQRSSHCFQFCEVVHIAYAIEIAVELPNIDQRERVQRLFHQRIGCLVAVSAPCPKGSRLSI